MNKKIPAPSISRLNLLYALLEKKETEGQEKIFSQEIGKELGIAPHSIRKDISFLGEIGNTIAGYDVRKLKEHIHKHLGFNRLVKICIVGLGRLGSALLKYERFQASNYKLVAGFDKNINTLEILRTDVPLYPVYEITNIVSARNIELAMIAVPAAAAQFVADKLVAGGVRGILNFAPVVIKPTDPGVFVQNIDLIGELRLLSAFLALDVNREESI